MAEQHPFFADSTVLARIEQIESSPEKQAVLNEIKAGMVSSVSEQYKMLWIGIPTLVILVFWLRNETVIMVALAALIYFWNKQRTAIRNKTTASYVEHFLLPVLHEVIPNAEVDYNSGIEKRILKVVTPRAESYSPNCHIMFNDERRTEFCNLWAYHTYEDSDGNTRTVEDFNGQVLTAEYPTGLLGHIRIVPTTRGLFGREKQKGYAKAQDGELKIETEDIRFNETFNVYCTDEVSSRTLLNPYLLRTLVEYREGCPITVTMDEKRVAVSFYTDAHILKRPSSRKEIESLSLSGEYKKVQNQLGQFYTLLDKVNSQL